MEANQERLLDRGLSRSFPNEFFVGLSNEIFLQENRKLKAQYTGLLSHNTFLFATDILELKR